MVEAAEVAVLGGGPVGLWLACELALAGTRVTVFERRAQRVVESRALTLHGRSLEMFASRGLADRFLAHGRSVPRMHYAALNTQLDLTVFETRYPFTQFLPQAITERLLEERALELGVDLRRGHQVESIAQHADEVRIEGHSAAGAFTCSARYAVGADGARSVVRRSADIAFDGYPASSTMMVADVALHAPPDNNALLTVNEAGAILVLPRGDGKYYRVGMLDASRRGASPAEPLLLPELAESMARVGGRDFLPHDPLWLSRFTDETRLARQFRKGRILLAGDAAHIQAPMGGQGLNVGLQDAMNLGWKLASVVRGSAPETLLDTYERERLAVASAFQDNTLAQLALFSHFDPPTLRLRQMLDEVLRFPDVNRRLAQDITGFGVNYPAPLDTAPDGWKHVDGVSGHRLRDLPVTLQDGTVTFACDLLKHGQWVCLQLARDRVPLDNRHMAEIVNAVHGGDNFYPDLAALLVRPDGYVSHVCPSSR